LAYLFTINRILQKQQPAFAGISGAISVGPGQRNAWALNSILAGAQLIFIFIISPGASLCVPSCIFSHFKLFCNYMLLDTDGSLTFMTRE